MGVIIKCENVNLWYDQGKPTELHALKDVSLEIEQGDYVAFFGPSGCGKTTMLYAISGIDRYQSGKIIVNGRDITHLSNKEMAIFRQTGIGIVFQQFNLVPSLTVLQNVALPMAFIGVSHEKSMAEAEKLLERLNISQFRDRYPSELSGGQQQRVGIARALANNPPVIVADEPLGNLDSENAKNVLAFLKELNEKDGRTIIMVTHEAWSLKDVRTIFNMKDGIITGKKHQQATGTETGKGTDTEHAAVETVWTSKVLTHFLMNGYSIDEITRFEFFLNQRISGKIDTLAFKELLDRPFREGGVGLWKGKAERISTYVEKAIEMRHDVEAIHILTADHPELSIEDEVKKMRTWLLEDYTGTLSDGQVLALDQAISDRLRNYINAYEFREILDLSKKQFGVGVSFRAAERLTEKLESVMSGDTKLAVPV